jgi:hypothetical protein
VNVDGEHIEYEEGTAEEVALRVKDEFGGAMKEPRLWRGLWRLSANERVEIEVLEMDWSAEPNTRTIKVGTRTLIVAACEPGALYHEIESELGLEDIYLCDKEGKEMTHQTDCKGKVVTVYQHVNRKKVMRAIWPFESRFECLIEGTGAEVKA